METNVQMLCPSILLVITIGTVIFWEFDSKPEFPNISQTNVRSPDCCVKVGERINIKDKASKYSSLKEDLPFPAHSSEWSQLLGYQVVVWTLGDG